jgi:hypothetical protein
MYGVKRFCPHLNAFGVGSTLIQTNAVRNRHIGTQVVSTGNLGNYAVTVTKIATNAVGGRAMAPNGVVGSHLATDIITKRHMGNQAVSAIHLATDAVASHLYGNKIFWNDLQTPGIAVGKKNSAPGLEAFRASGGLLINKFDSGTEEQVYADFQFDHSMKDQTTIFPHVHWCPVDAGTGYVRWRLEYSWTKIDGVFPDPTIVSVIATAPGVAWQQTINGFPSFVVSSLSGVLKTRLFRSGASDTYSTDAGLIFFDIHYQKDMPGSRLEYTK